MVELWLKFKGPDGAEQRVPVDKEKFTIGRHSANDLPIADGRLSREHALIERYGDVFVISDRGSSNGIELNGVKLTDPASIKADDKLSLGGLDVELEFLSDEPAAEPPPPPTPPVPEPTAAQPSASAGQDGIPKALFIIIPIFAVLVLAGLGAVFLMSGGRNTSVDNSNFVYSDDTDDPPSKRKGKNSNSEPKSNSVDVVTTTTTPTISNGAAVPSPTTSDPDISKTETNASAFMRKIALNDPRAFVIGEPAKAVLAKIKSMSGSSAVAANINSARKSSAQIKGLAVSKNLKPDMLAVAAITKLGGSSGDVFQSAQSMADILGRLSTQLSGELGEETLVIVAVYDQGAAGDFQKMRNTLQALATKKPELVREIRTIWYLKKEGKITDPEYDFALRFLAIGAIAQNPKEFGVNAEALTF